VILTQYYSLIPEPIRRSNLWPLINAIPASFGYKSVQINLRWLDRMAFQDGNGERLAEAESFFRFSQ
jgi:hypothetical protein